MGFSGYSSVQDGGNLPSFSSVPTEDKKLYTRNSFGGVYNYRDSTMDSCDFPLRTSLADTPRNDLTMANLQDVMEENLFSPTQPLSSVPSVGPVGPVGPVGSVGSSLATSVGSSLATSVGPTLATSTGPTSYFSGKDGLNSGSTSSLGFGMNNLKNGYGTMMSRPLSSSSNGFMLSSFDNDDFTRPCTRAECRIIARQQLAHAALAAELLHAHEEHVRRERCDDERLHVGFGLLSACPLFSRPHIALRGCGHLASSYSRCAELRFQLPHDAVAPRSSPAHV